MDVAGETMLDARRNPLFENTNKFDIRLRTPYRIDLLPPPKQSSPPLYWNDLFSEFTMMMLCAPPRLIIVCCQIRETSSPVQWQWLPPSHSSYIAVSSTFMACCIMLCSCGVVVTSDANQQAARMLMTEEDVRQFTRGGSK